MNKQVQSGRIGTKREVEEEVGVWKEWDVRERNRGGMRLSFFPD